MMGGLWHQFCHWQPESPLKTSKMEIKFDLVVVTTVAFLLIFFYHSSDTSLNVCISVCALVSSVVRISCECC